jgi:hypothetical protein
MCKMGKYKSYNRNDKPEEPHSWLASNNNLSHSGVCSYDPAVNLTDAGSLKEQTPLRQKKNTLMVQVYKD